MRRMHGCGRRHRWTKPAPRTSCSLPRFEVAWQVSPSAWGRDDAAVVSRYRERRDLRRSPADLRALSTLGVKRAGRTMPSRPISTCLIRRPAENGLVDVLYDSAQGRLRLSLQRHPRVEVRGANPVASAWPRLFRPDRSERLGCYQTVVPPPSLISTTLLPARWRIFADEANIFLPLSNDGEHVNMILVYTAYRRVR